MKTLGFLAVQANLEVVVSRTTLIQYLDKIMYRWSLFLLGDENGQIHVEKNIIK